MQNKKILVIGAHADDIELGLGGTIAKYTSQNHEVNSLLITNSEYRDFTGKVIRTKDTALNEANKAAKILGIQNINCLDYKTKEVIFDVSLIERINECIDNIKPDVIYTHWDADLNQDHSAIARATITAGRNIPRILMYRSNWYKSHINFDGNFYIDISDFVDKKIDAINAHQSETSRRGPRWAEHFITMTQIWGQEVGVKNAECFKVIKWLE
jgi:LmbE family N-acetylglucosaminyl deacetylase